jgi:WD40 repeat protein
MFWEVLTVDYASGFTQQKIHDISWRIHQMHVSYSVSKDLYCFPIVSSTNATSAFCSLVVLVQFIISFHLLVSSFSCCNVVCNVPVSAATFDRTGRYAITGSDDRLVKIWAMETAFCLASCRGHEVSFAYCNATPINIHSPLLTYLPFFKLRVILLTLR